MVTIVRHDAVTLHREVTNEDFEQFMQQELVPYFSEQYQGPTRTSISDLKSQVLLKDTKGQRKYLWITQWDGSADSVRGSSFENTRMVRFEKTEAMLVKLNTFGKRSSEKIFSELVCLDVPTNT